MRMFVGGEWVEGTETITVVNPYGGSPVDTVPKAGPGDVETPLATVARGVSNAGQVCISTQRVLVDRSVYGDFLDALVPQVEADATGNPLEETVAMGTMVREADAVRVGRG